MKKLCVAIVAVLLVLSGCDDRDADENKGLSAEGATFDEALDNLFEKMKKRDAAAARESDSSSNRKEAVTTVRDATPEEIDEFENLAIEAYQNWLDDRTALAIAQALDAHWRTEGRANTWDSSPFKYHIVEGDVESTMPLEAQQNGIMAAAGFLVEAEATFFRTVMTSYMIFDDRSAANTYFEGLSRDMAGVAGPYRSFDLDVKHHPSFTMRCG
jgi:hypothetical protein